MRQRKEVRMHNFLNQLTGVSWNPSPETEKKIEKSPQHSLADAISIRKGLLLDKNLKAVFESTINDDALVKPFTWTSDRMVATCSTKDLFRPKNNLAFICKVFTVMNQNPAHIFLVSTNYSERLLDLNRKLTWSKNIWLGVNVKSTDEFKAITHLQKCFAKLKFITAFNLIEPVRKIPLKNIDWVVADGVSGNKLKTVQKSWIVDILGQCRKNKIPFYFKGWDTNHPTEKGKLINGREFQELPNANNSNINDNQYTLL